MLSNEQVDEFRRELLKALECKADPIRAVGQQAYMKSALPFWGLPVPEVRKITTAIMKARPFENEEIWESTICSVWRRAKRREERYAAIGILNFRKYSKWVVPDRIQLVEELVVTGAWWDFVDAIASKGMNAMMSNDPTETSGIMRIWARDENIWKRRTAILCQLHRKQRTDLELLADAIEPSLDHKEFFVRKAIGWALREYSKVNAEFVVKYVQSNTDRLSPLSRMEGLKFVQKHRSDLIHDRIA